MKYKFKIGDKLKIIKGGAGMHPSTIGKTFTVKGLGGYFGGWPGYEPVEKFNATEITSSGFPSEESFELYESAEFIPQIFN